VSAAGEARAELTMLARVLGVAGPDALSCAAVAPAIELRGYRRAVSEVLFDDGRELLARAAETARLLPPLALARIGERALGPLVCARLTSLLDADRAAEIARHLTLEFLAELAAELDPRRVAGVLTATPSERVVAIALQMAAKGEYVGMGRFVGHLQDEALRACVEELSDRQLLRVSFVLEDKRRMAEIVELIGRRRVRRMLRDAAGEGLGEEASELLDHLDARQRRLLSERPRGSA
jgi:hypothetical protein